MRSNHSPVSTVDAGKHIRLISKFDERKVEEFFQHFEKKLPSIWVGTGLFGRRWFRVLW